MSCLLLFLLLLLLPVCFLSSLEQIRHKEGPKGAWLGVGMIFLILSLLPKILEPAKVLIQVVVTFFFSTLFVMLAHSDIEERS